MEINSHSAFFFIISSSTAGVFHILSAGLSVVFLGLLAFLLSVRIHWQTNLCVSF